MTPTLLSCAPWRVLSDNTRQYSLYDSRVSRQFEGRAAASLAPHTLMTRAGLSLTRLARAIAPHARRVWIAAGPGNNGGDGLILATALHHAGVEVRVSLIGHSPTQRAPDAAWALETARAAGVTLLPTLPDADTLATTELAIDALLGLGQNRAPTGLIAQAIAALNTCRAPILAVDVPTGLCADSGAALGDEIVRATHTLSLLTLKPGLFTGAGREVAGEIWFDNLGLAQTPTEPDDTVLSSAARAAALYPIRGHLAHKGSFGDVHILGGASGMVGAALLAGRAASVGGAGRVLVHTGAADRKADSALTVDVAHPQLMLQSMAALHTALRTNHQATIVAGCGGGTEIARELPRCLSQANRLVLDADALNAVARDKGLRQQLRQRGARGLPTILTPHPQEAARLLASTTAAVQTDRLGAARRLATDLGAVVILKGSGTLIAGANRRTAINPSGDARLATAGSGDVLAGWLAGLWSAQANTPTPAAALAQDVAEAAVLVHGRACEFASNTHLPLVARDLITAIAAATQRLSA